MKLNLRYTIESEIFEFETDFENDDDRKEQMKLIKKTLADLNPVEIKDYCRRTTKHDLYDTNDNESTPVKEPQPATSQPAPASAGQIAYMEKLGITIPKDCTVSQAIELINQYKIAHNIPIKNLGNKK